MSEAILEARDLWVTGRDPAASLRGVSLRVEPGQMVAVVGGPRAGKSLLVRCLGLDYPPTSGTVLLAGRDITRAGAEEKRRLRSSHIALVHPPIEQPGDVVAAIPVSYMGPGTEDLGASRRRHPSTMPASGLRQRIQVAGALSKGVRLLLLDEPFLGVELSVRLRILELVDELRHDKGAAVVLTTRHRAGAEAVADEVLCLAQGTLVAGEPLESSSPAVA